LQNGAHKVLVLGVGNIGRNYALACHKLDGFEIVDLCRPSVYGRNDLPAS